MLQSPPPLDRCTRLAEALADLPVFPLPSVVLFPGGRLALHIFEPRYRAMLEHCLSTHRCMAVTRVADGADVSEDLPRIERIAGVGLIVEHEPLPDGRSNIVLEGVARVRLDEHPFVAPFRRALAHVLEDLPAIPDPREVASLVQIASTFVAHVRIRHPNSGLRMPDGVSADRIADVLAQDLVLDPQERQLLLETLDPRVRVRRLLATIAGQWHGLRSKESRAAAN